jgi:hypothetical protein
MMFAEDVFSEAMALGYIFPDRNGKYLACFKPCRLEIIMFER